MSMSWDPVTGYGFKIADPVRAKQSKAFTEYVRKTLLEEGSTESVEDAIHFELAEWFPAFTSEYRCEPYFDNSWAIYNYLDPSVTSYCLVYTESDQYRSVDISPDFQTELRRLWLDLDQLGEPELVWHRFTWEL